MKVTAVVTAAGMGKRFGGDTPKQFLSISNRPILYWTLLAFDKASTIDDVILVLPKSELLNWTLEKFRDLGIRKLSKVIEGGEQRQDSVRLGLSAVSKDTKLVAIHDGARCLITPSLIDQTVTDTRGFDGAILALPIRDTVKRVRNQAIVETLDRNELWVMQTPQVIRFPMLLHAYQEAHQKNLVCTDDASAAALLDAKLTVSLGSTQNLKITYPEDLRLAEQFLTQDERWESCN